jgi:hypothetical protein
MRFTHKVSQSLRRHLTALIPAAVSKARLREQIEMHGELVPNGPVLTFHEKNEPPSSVLAGNVQEVWYDFNPFGWQHANSWRLVHLAAGERRTLSVFEHDHLVKPLRAWCVRHLPHFNGEVFDRLPGSAGGDDKDILAWSRHTGSHRVA